MPYYLFGYYENILIYYIEILFSGFWFSVVQIFLDSVCHWTGSGRNCRGRGPSILNIRGAGESRWKTHDFFLDIAKENQCLVFCFSQIDSHWPKVRRQGVLAILADLASHFLNLVLVFVNSEAQKYGSTCKLENVLRKIEKNKLGFKIIYLQEGTFQFRSQQVSLDLDFESTV